MIVARRHLSSHALGRIRAATYHAHGTHRTRRCPFVAVRTRVARRTARRTLRVAIGPRLTRRARLCVLRRAERPCLTRHAGLLSLTARGPLGTITALRAALGAPLEHIDAHLVSPTFYEVLPVADGLTPMSDQLTINRCARRASLLG